MAFTAAPAKSASRSAVAAPATVTAPAPGGVPDAKRVATLATCLQRYFTNQLDAPVTLNTARAVAPSLTGWAAVQPYVYWGVFCLVCAIAVVLLTPGVVLCVPPMTTAQCEAAGVGSGTAALTQCTAVVGTNGGHWNAAALVVHALLLVALLQLLTYVYHLMDPDASW